MTLTKGTVAIIFTTKTAVTLGNASRLSIIEYLSKSFDAVFFTDQVKFVQTRLKQEKIVELPTYNSQIPVFSDFTYWKKVSRIINGSKYDAVFMIYELAPIANWLRPPVFQYIHQHGQRSDDNSNILIQSIKNVFSGIKNYYIIRGLKKSVVNFVVSQPIIEILQKKGVNNLIHTPHGVDLAKYQKPCLSDIHKKLKELKENGCFIITYTGWICENRGFQLMLDSIKEVARIDQQVILVLAGADKEFSKKIKDYATENQLTANIINLGIVDSSDIPGILHFSDVCLSFLDDSVPAYRISPPQKVIEYFAAGKPVICNKIATHERLVNHKENGFVLNPEAGEVTNAIILLKNNHELYKKMSLNALKTVSGYDIHKIYGKMVKQIKDALERSQ